MPPAPPDGRWVSIRCRYPRTRDKWGASRASAPPPALSTPRAACAPSGPRTVPQNLGWAGSPDCKVRWDRPVRGTWAEGKLPKEKRKLRSSAIGRLAGGALQGPQPHPCPLSSCRTPAAPRPHSSHGTPSSLARTHPAAGTGPPPAVPPTTPLPAPSQPPRDAPRPRPQGGRPAHAPRLA